MKTFDLTRSVLIFKQIKQGNNINQKMNYEAESVNEIFMERS